MIHVFAKGDNVQLSTNFNAREFQCRCKYPECRVTLISSDLVTALETLRLLTGSVKINDGYRCVKHNRDVGGVRDSQHPTGNAADIESPRGPDDTADAAEKVKQFQTGGIGRYTFFTHVDVRAKKARWDFRSLKG